MIELSRSARRVVVYVELHRREHGRGPAWGFVARELGMPRGKAAGLIAALVRDGALSATCEQGSLRTTPEGLRLALGRPAGRRGGGAP